MSRLVGPVRASVEALSEVISNPGLRRLELGWLLGIAADGALVVAMLVVAYVQGGVVAAGLLGAIRMGPAVLSGMLTGAILARVRGDLLLVGIAVARTVGALAIAALMAAGGPLWALFALAALMAGAGAPIRPTEATLMPALARGPSELIAGNVAWSLAEGVGALAGPFVAGLLVAAGQPALAAACAAVAFAGTAIAAAGLRFEHAGDALGASADTGRGLRLGDGMRALRRRRSPGWSMVGVFGQVFTRGALNVLVVVAAIELIGMGDSGVGLLNAALGLGGLLGGIFAVSMVGSTGLIRSQSVALAWWGVPIAVIGFVPDPAIALAAMVLVGVANGVYDVTIFTIFQRGCTNAERAPIFAVFEGVAGLGFVSGSLVAPVLLGAFGIRGALAVTGALLPILSLVIYSRIGRDDHVSVVDEDAVRLLRSVAEFAQLPMTAVERLADGAVGVEYAPGAELMRQGDPGDRFIVVAAGEVEVRVDGHVVHRLGRGAGVGEIALLRHRPRTATVTAIGPVETLCIDAGTFLAAVSGPAAALLTERIAEANLARTGSTDGGAASAREPGSTPL